MHFTVIEEELLKLLMHLDKLFRTRKFL